MVLTVRCNTRVVELDEAKMLCVPSVDIDIPQFHMAFDPKQLEVSQFGIVLYISLSLHLLMQEEYILCVMYAYVYMYAFCVVPICVDWDVNVWQVLMSIIGTITRRVNQCRSHMHLTRSGVMVSVYWAQIMH